MKQHAARVVLVGAMVIAMVVGLCSIAAGEDDLVLLPEQIADLVTQYWSGDAAVTAVATAIVESNGGNTKLISSTGDYGLWQINLAAHPDFSMADALDPIKATAYAFQLYGWEGNSFNVWKAYKYRDYYLTGHGEPSSPYGTKQWWDPAHVLATQVIPEPSSLLALGSGLVGLSGFFYRRRRR